MADWKAIQQKYAPILAIVFLLVVAVIAVAPSETGYLSFGKSSFWKSKAASPAVAIVKEGIVFNSNRTGNWELFTMNTGGTGVRQLTNTPTDEIMPSLTNGKIVYVEELFPYARTRNIWIMNADGTVKKKLTTTDNDYNPALSPDGAKIAFSSGRDYKDVGIYIMNTDGTNVRKIANSADSPRWSVDGKKIVYRASRPDAIYTMNADGSGKVKVYGAGSALWYPDFSPDGKKITFVKDDGRSFHIYTINTDGTDLKQLTTGDNIYHDTPRYSLGGKSIIFARSTTLFTDNYWNIFVMNTDGTNQMPLTSLRSYNWYATYGPLPQIGLPVQPQPPL